MPATVLRPTRNLWRIVRTTRASILVDGASFFGAVRQAFINAKRSIFIVGWDIDSRMWLVGEDCEPKDGYPAGLVDLLTELVNERPDLEIYILLWDYSVVYAAERELFPRLALQWRTPSRITLCMDDALPLGSSQHQKLIVVDDELAFSGGLDLTQHRWDTSEHLANNSDRVDASGCPYPPFHDVQMAVSGAAAQALAELVRERYSKPPIQPSGDPWPVALTPDFHDVDVGIARTQPAFEDRVEVREVESLSGFDRGGGENNLHRKPVYDVSADRPAHGSPT